MVQSRVVRIEAQHQVDANNGKHCACSYEVPKKESRRLAKEI